MYLSALDNVHSLWPTAPLPFPLPQLSSQTLPARYNIQSPIGPWRRRGTLKVLSHSAHVNFFYLALFFLIYLEIELWKSGLNPLRSFLAILMLLFPFIRWRSTIFPFLARRKGNHSGSVSLFWEMLNATTKMAADGSSSSLSISRLTRIFPLFVLLSFLY